MRLSRAGQRLELTTKDTTSQGGEDDIADDLADPDEGKGGVDDEAGDLAGRAAAFHAGYTIQLSPHQAS